MNPYKKKNYGPFLWMGFNCLKVTAISRRQFTFYHSVPRNSWYSFYQPRKDERPSRPWSHPVVLNTGLLDWESSTLTTRLLFNLLAGCLIYHLFDNFVYKVCSYDFRRFSKINKTLKKRNPIFPIYVRGWSKPFIVFDFNLPFEKVLYKSTIFLK